MNTSSYPIYVISLKRTPERRLYVQRQLEALNLDYQFVDAIDKRDLDFPEYQAEVANLLGIDKTIIEKKQRGHFRKHYACALSHAKAYNLMVKNNDSAACILEDDVWITSDFPDVLHAAPKTSWDILMLSSHSRAIRYIPSRNPNIQKSLEEFPEIDCSLFPKVRRTRWYKKILPPTPSSHTQLDYTAIPNIEWWLLMLLSSSRTANKIFRYSINAYKYLLEFYNPSHYIIGKNKRDPCKRIYIACRIGGLPVRPSQKTLYKNYDIAIPAEMPTSGMAYLLTLATANKFIEEVSSERRMWIDAIPWYLYQKRLIKLRILTPPCAMATLSYLKNQTREGL